jgi:peroxiredoxin/DNA-directed RNA polymerase subunit RPC12/RpoP
MEDVFRVAARRGARAGSHAQSSKRCPYGSAEPAVSDGPRDHGLAYEELCCRHAELLQEAEQLRAACDRAVMISRTKSEFLSRLSEELLPPLAALLAPCQTLLSDGAGAKDRRLAELQRVQSAGRTLLALLNCRTTCGGCQKRLRYRLEMVGNWARCPSCGHRFLLRPQIRAARLPTPAAPHPPQRRRSWLLHAGAALAVLLVGLVLGALLPWPNPVDLLSSPRQYSYYSAAYSTAFKDDVRSNANPSAESLMLQFVDSTGRTVDLRHYRGKKNVVLVINRGFNGQVCLTCQTITSRLIQNYQAFTSRDAEVLVVYPGPRRRVAEFIDAVRANASGASVPFPVLLDEDSRVVKRLGIEADLARPSTYILDKAGQVRFAYVGSAPADRPSVKALLDQLDRLVKG